MLSPVELMFRAITPYLREASLHLTHSRYHFTDEAPFTVQTAEGDVALGNGWLAISELEYQGLLWLQEEYMRKFAPESLSNPTFATVETWELVNGKLMTEAQKTAVFKASEYIAARRFDREHLGFNGIMNAMEDVFGGEAGAVYRALKANLDRAYDAMLPKMPMMTREQACE